MTVPGEGNTEAHAFEGVVDFFPGFPLLMQGTHGCKHENDCFAFVTALILRPAQETVHVDESKQGPTVLVEIQGRIPA